jgi:hypothetical protein
LLAVHFFLSLFSSQYTDITYISIKYQLIWSERTEGPTCEYSFFQKKKHVLRGSGFALGVRRQAQGVRPKASLLASCFALGYAGQDAAASLPRSENLRIFHSKTILQGL